MSAWSRIVLLFVWPIAMATAAPAPMSAAQAERFVADLDVLAEDLPKRHANLYHSTAKPEFDRAFATLRQRLPELSRGAAIVELARLIGLARDGHSALFMLPFPGAEPISGMRQLPMQLYAFDDGVRVVAIDKALRQHLGARVTAVGGVPIDTAIGRILPLLPRDNVMGEREYSAWYLALYDVLQALGLAPGSMAEFSLVDAAGKTSQLRLAPMTSLPDAGWASQWISLPGPRAAWVGVGDSAPTPRWLARAAEPWWFETMPDGSVYAQINLLRQSPAAPFAGFVDDLLAAVPQRADARLIIDLRLNRGGDGELRWPLIHALIRHGHLQAGNVRVLTSRRTFSAAQLLANDLERHLGALFIGEPTGSSPNHYGELGLLSLPNTGLQVAVSTLYWQHHPRDLRPWIAPHRAIALRYADLAAGRDAVLEAALAYEPPPSIVDLLRPHLQAHQLDAAIAAFRNVEAKHRNSYRNLFEKPLNDLGYELLAEQRAADAVALLRLAVELYPDSWNAWDSLGEAYAQTGVRHRAAYAYARSLRLNPSNSSGADVLQQLLRSR